MAKDAVVKANPASEEDVPGIVELWTEMMRYHGGLDPRFELAGDALASFEKYLKSSLAEPGRLILVARDGNALVGYVNAQVKTHPPVFATRRHGEITELAVAESHRGRGIGQMLVDHARRWLMDQGVAQVEASAATKNETAISFWTKQGFESYFTVMAADVEPSRDEPEPREHGAGNRAADEKNERQ